MCLKGPSSVMPLPHSLESPQDGSTLLLNQPTNRVKRGQGYGSVVVKTFARHYCIEKPGFKSWDTLSLWHLFTVDVFSGYSIPHSFLSLKKSQPISQPTRLTCLLTLSFIWIWSSLFYTPLLFLASQWRFQFLLKLNHVSNSWLFSSMVVFVFIYFLQCRFSLNFW